MAEYSSRHRETWVLMISPAAGCRWPERPVPNDDQGRQYQPELVTVVLERGLDHPTITVSGTLAGVTPGAPRGVQESVFWFTPPGGWLDNLIRDGRQSEGLAPHQTGVGW